jgi:hypothetical protein
LQAVHDSVVAWGWGAAVLVDLVVAISKAVAIILNGGRRYGRIAESWMTRGIGRSSAGDIATTGLNAVVEALASDLSPAGRGRRRVVSNWAWMGTSSQDKRQSDRR